MRRPLLIAVLLLLVLSPAGYAHAQTALCFTETQQCLSGPFRSYWERNGGLGVFGLPLSPVQAEVNADTGRTYLTLWLERARLELHPELQPPYDVLQGRLGADMRIRGAAAGPTDHEPGPQKGCLWFGQTGHNVCDQQAGVGFMSYWQSHGLSDQRLNGYDRSLALFGLPLTAPQTMTNSSGDTVQTQWFERARFEWHPAEPTASKVLLGRLGSEVFKLEATTPHATSGITGIMTIGPTCPVTRPGQACADRPFQAIVAAEDALTKQPIMETSSGQDGHFVLGLPPGTYTLLPHTAQAATYPRAAPLTVVVPANQFVDVTIRFDSGIR